MSDYGDPFDDDAVSPDFIKDPDSIEDFAFNWVMDLDGDTIQSSTFSLPDGLTEVSSTNDVSLTQIFLSGGDAGRTYRVVNRIVTTPGGRTLDKTMRIYVRER
jgi:hypothetical protein